MADAKGFGGSDFSDLLELTGDLCEEAVCSSVIAIYSRGEETAICTAVLPGNANQGGIEAAAKDIATLVREGFPGMARLLKECGYIVLDPPNGKIRK